MPPHPAFAKNKNDTADYRRAKDLRRSSSLAEQKLWNALRVTMKTHGYKFRRQHPIHPYIVDFICLTAKLVIELDGPSHDMRQGYDEKRTAFLGRHGYKVLRFSNQNVHDNLDGVVIHILHQVQKLTTVLASPLP